MRKEEVKKIFLSAPHKKIQELKKRRDAWKRISEGFPNNAHARQIVKDLNKEIDDLIAAEKQKKNDNKAARPVKAGAPANTNTNPGALAASLPDFRNSITVKL